MDPRMKKDRRAKHPIKVERQVAGLDRKRSEETRLQFSSRLCCS